MTWRLSMTDSSPHSRAPSEPLDPRPLGGSGRPADRRLSGAARFLHRQCRDAGDHQRASARSRPTMQLVISGYAVVYAVFLITGGRLGDIFGRKADLPDRPRRLRARLGASAASPGRRPRSSWRGCCRRWPPPPWRRRRWPRCTRCSRRRNGPRAQHLWRHARPLLDRRPVARRRARAAPISAASAGG